MSLINKMLRDLDARHAPTRDRAALPSDVHVHGLPPERPRFRLPLLLALVAAGAAYVYFLTGPGELPPSPPPQARPPQPRQPVAVATPPPAMPVVPETAALIPPLVVEAPVPPPVVAPVPATAVASTAAGNTARKKGTHADVLRLETDLHSIKKSPASESAAVPVAPASPVAAPAKPVQATKEAAPSSDPTSIDKRPRTSLSNDAAENEYRKAMAALRRGATAQAMEELRGVLKINNRHVSARQALLSLLVEQQQWDEAQPLIVEGLALDPAQTGWAMALARLQLENGKIADAAETLARHAGYAEQNADYLAFYALLLQKQKRSREAAERYRAALTLKPTESRWWYGLGLSLEADQKPQEARTAFLKAKETGNLPPELSTVVDQHLR